MPDRQYEHAPNDLTDDDVFRKAKTYFMAVSNCRKNSNLYCQEMRSMVTIATELIGRKTRIRLLFTEDTEILTRQVHVLKFINKV